MSKMNLFFKLSKIDEATRTVSGIATAELPDKSGEVCDYASTVPYYKAWSGEIEKASGGKSKGNIRAMHGNIAAGVVKNIIFNDALKQIEICAKIVDEAEWQKCLEGVYTGFSQGGSYAKTWKKDGLTYYTADPAEISIVDNPCLGAATFELKRSDGSCEMRKLKSEPTEEEIAAQAEADAAAEAAKSAPVQVWKAQDGSEHATQAEALQKNMALRKAAIVSPGAAALAELTAAITKAEGAKEDDDEAASNGEDTSKGGADDDEGDDAKDKAKKAVDAAFAKIGELVKSSVWDAQCALDALLNIECVISSEEWETMFGGESQPQQLADLKAACASLKSFIASEIMESDEDMLAASNKARDMLKACKSDAEMDVVLAELVKAGSRHVTDTAALAKAADDLALEKARGDELQTQLDEIIPQLKNLTVRVTKFEKAPAAAKGKLFVIEKGHEVAAEGEPVTAPAHLPTPQERLTPAQRAAAITRND